MYASDWPWWLYWKGVPEFRGQKWTQHRPSQNVALRVDLAASWGIRVVRGEYGDGLSLDPSHINLGGNSGFQALNLAVLFGAAKILLIGFDMGGKPWNDRDRPRQFRQRSEDKFTRWIQRFNAAAPQLEAAGIDVVNCSESSALTCFRKASLADEIDDVNSGVAVH